MEILLFKRVVLYNNHFCIKVGRIISKELITTAYLRLTDVGNACCDGYQSAYYIAATGNTVGHCVHHCEERVDGQLH